MITATYIYIIIYITTYNSSVGWSQDECAREGAERQRASRLASCAPPQPVQQPAWCSIPGTPV